jgi:hypothetical protein
MPQAIAEDSEVICLAADASMMPWDIWHHCMGHMSCTCMCELNNCNMLKGLMIDKHILKGDCISCT